jgi:uncharacterized protein YndB with AHSA1/START domain
MIPQTRNPELSLNVTRILTASPARAFEAWTKPEILHKWWGQDEGHTTPVIEVDLQVGGSWRIEIQPPNNEERITIGGEYLEIVPNEKLVFTWRWGRMDTNAPSTVVTVVFLPHPKGTVLRLTHKRFTEEPDKAHHEEGWQGILSALALVVESA